MHQQSKGCVAWGVDVKKAILSWAKRGIEGFKKKLWSSSELRILELKNKLWSSSQIANSQLRDYLVGLSNYDDLKNQKDNMIELTLSLAPPLLLLVTSGLETQIHILIIWSKNHILFSFSSLKNLIHMTKKMIFYKEL